MVRLAVTVAVGLLLRLVGVVAVSGSRDFTEDRLAPFLKDPTTGWWFWLNCLSHVMLGVVFFVAGAAAVVYAVLEL